MVEGARSSVWLEHPAHNRVVMGSSPFGPTIVSLRARGGGRGVWSSSPRFPVFGLVLWFGGFLRVLRR